MSTIAASSSENVFTHPSGIKYAKHFEFPYTFFDGNLGGILAYDFKLGKLDHFQKFFIPKNVTGFSKIAALVSMLVNRIAHLIFKGQWINEAELGKKINEYRFTYNFSQMEEGILRDNFNQLIGEGEYENFFDSAMEETWYDTIRNGLSFLGNFIQAPLTVGAVLPSSHFLAQRVSKFITPSQEGTGKHFLEAGPGTGEFTLQIVKQLGPNDQLDLVEYDEKFCNILRQRFGHLKNVHVQHASILDWKPVDYKYDAVVSGLPLNNFPSTMVGKIYDKFLEVIKEEGHLSYFEYPFFPDLRNFFVPKEDRKDLEQSYKIKQDFYQQYTVGSEIECLNVPPARVKHCQVKKQD
jgi:phospholipid N-methyltransferase